MILPRPQRALGAAPPLALFAEAPTEMRLGRMLRERLTSERQSTCNTAAMLTHLRNSHGPAV
jgi:hypothetical protein